MPASGTACRRPGSQIRLVINCQLGRFRVSPVEALPKPTLNSFPWSIRHLEAVKNAVAGLWDDKIVSATANVGCEEVGWGPGHEIG